MARPAEDEHRREEQPGDHEMLIAIMLLLMAGLEGSVLLHSLLIVLAPLGVPPVALAGLLALMGPQGTAHVPPSANDDALRMLQRGTSARRAMYLLAAARRLSAGGTLDAERRLYKAHLVAERKRGEAVGRVDAAAKQFGPVLGWWAHRDKKTTPVCRTAHGSNFSALTPPAIGWPGTLHAGNCRCKPVAPWPQGVLLA